jgi:hypothetical protein
MFDKTIARYFRFRALAAASGLNRAGIAEIDVITD